MTPTSGSWSLYREIIEKTPAVRRYGRVNQVIGLVIEGLGPAAAIGDICRIQVKGRGGPIPAEVVGFRDHKILLMPLGDSRGIQPGDAILPLGVPAQAQVAPALLGRVLDAMGNPLDDRRPLKAEKEYPLYAPPADPVFRRRISDPVDVGVKAINALLAIGKGQRMAVFSGSGVGKSTLLGMMARHTTAQVNVVALIGERGREVREFIEKDLGEEGLERSVVVVATSDQHPLLRMRGAYLATAIAEYFRDRNQDVLLMMDSITRFAMAAREVGLAIGEPPASKGYTPSVFAQLPKLLERAGTSAGQGSITGLYTVLVEGDDLNDPVADSIRSIADGHIVLSRDLANQSHYPPIDILASVSRVMNDIVSPEQKAARNQLVSLLAVYRKAEDLINIGAYVKGSNPQIDYAIKKIGEVQAFLRQGVDEKVPFAESLAGLRSLFP
jgi:flagellum-specific ATP synthase